MPEPRPTRGHPGGWAATGAPAPAMTGRGAYHRVTAAKGATLNGSSSAPAHERIRRRIPSPADPPRRVRRPRPRLPNDRAGARVGRARTRGDAADVGALARARGGGGHTLRRRTRVPRVPQRRGGLSTPGLLRGGRVRHPRHAPARARAEAGGGGRRHPHARPRARRGARGGPRGDTHSPRAPPPPGGRPDLLDRRAPAAHRARPRLLAARHAAGGARPGARPAGPQRRARAPRPAAAQPRPRRHQPAAGAGGNLPPAGVPPRRGWMGGRVGSKYPRGGPADLGAPHRGRRAPPARTHSC